MGNHPSTLDMRVPELKACGCPRCLDALGFHDTIDGLILDARQNLAALNLISARHKTKKKAR